MPESHGGNIYLLAESLGMKEDAIMDFSASINPLGVPDSVVAAIKENLKHLFHYPDPEAKKLRRKISEHIGVGAESILCGNGSTELIFLVVRALSPARVLIPAPTFSEYERACIQNGAAIVTYPLREEHNFDIDAKELILAMGAGNALSSRCNMVFLCNPNNPTGRLMSKEDMLKISDAAKRLACVLVVDEAFIDFCSNSSIIDEVRNNPYLVVLRSLTKMYALSGLRVGYAVLPASLLESLKEAKEPWTVNTLAQIAGVTALDDDEYTAETFRMIEEEKRFLEEGFRALGISFFPSSANFYLLQTERAAEIAAHLRGKGILVRDCSTFSGLDSSYIRVAVKARSENVRLLEEISACTG